MVTDYHGAELTEGDLVEAFAPSEGVFPARVAQFHEAPGMVTIARIDTGERLTRSQETLIKMSGE